MSQGNKMKKQLLTVGIVVILLAIWSSGCIENSFKYEENNFIGTWETVETSSDSEIWTFYSNDTVKTVSSYLEEGEEEPYILTSWSNYDIVDGRLCFKNIGENIDNPPTCFDYEFSNGNKNLTLSYKGVVALVLSIV